MGGLSHTVSGDIASFRTPSRVPIENLKFHFLPKQEGSGDPSPTNIRPITGWTGLNGTRSKKNLIKPHFTEATSVRGMTITPTEKGVRVQGTASAEHPIRLSSQDIRFLDLGKKYTFSLYINGDISGCKDPYLGYHDGTIYRNIGSLTQENDYKFTWTVPDKYANASAPWFDMYIRVLEGSTVDFEIGLQMEAGENATAYEPYSSSTIPITFPSNGKNLIDQSIYTFPDNTAVEIVDGVFKNKLTDTRSNLQLQVQLYDTPTHIVSAPTAINVFSTGRSALTFSVNFAGCSYLVLKHNGVKKDFKIMFPFNYGIGTYTISVDVLSADPTTVGGVQLKNIQVELGDTATTYEPYSSDNTFYGGYIDPVGGEIVAEYVYKKCNGTENGWTTSGTFVGVKRFHSSPAGLGLPAPVNSSTSKAKFNIVKNGTSVEEWKGFIGSTGNILFYVPESIDTTSKWRDYLSEHNLEICYQLAMPIHIPLSPQQLQAFLDHNNFWSDANDITEVTYAVTESKDILETRKKAAAFEAGHHKICEWNQLVKDGNFTGNTVDKSKWVAASATKGSMILSDNIGIWTCNEAPSQYYQTGFTWSGGAVSNYNYLYIPWNHKIVVMAKAYCTIACKLRLFALVGSGAHVWAYNQTLSANTWTDVIGFIPDRREDPQGEDDGFIKRIKPCITGVNNISEIVAGTVLKLKDLMMFDLTQMFGLGNEPATVEEFERICALSGIDLSTYQAYDAGSNKWLIIP